MRDFRLFFCSVLAAIALVAGTAVASQAVPAITSQPDEVTANATTSAQVMVCTPNKCIMVNKTQYCAPGNPGCGSLVYKLWPQENIAVRA